eukprot:COSAG02_NODE_19350_length_886_cov_1.113088_1_plen_112_part_01
MRVFRCYCGEHICAEFALDPIHRNAQYPDPLGTAKRVGRSEPPPTIVLRRELADFARFATHAPLRVRESRAVAHAACGCVTGRPAPRMAASSSAALELDDRLRSDLSGSKAK